MSNDKIFRPNMKLVGTDGALAAEEDLEPSTFRFTLKNGATVTDTGFLAVTSSFIAIMNTDDQLALVVPMPEILYVTRVPEVVITA